MVSVSVFYVIALYLLMQIEGRTKAQQRRQQCPFRDLSEVRIDALDGVSSVHDFANSATAVEQLGHMAPISNPCVNRTRISASGGAILVFESASAFP